MQISPGIAHPPSRLCLSDIRRSVPYKYWALMIWDISPRYAASYPLPVRQASALPSASSRFAVVRDTLAVQLTLPLAGRVEVFHLQVSAPCRAHHEKSPSTEGLWCSTYARKLLTGASPTQITQAAKQRQQHAEVKLAVRIIRAASARRLDSWDARCSRGI